MRSTTLLFALLALAAAPFAASAEGSGDMGEQLFQLCAQCHGPDGGGDPVALAPAIAGMDEWYVNAQLAKFHNGARGTHPDDIAGMRMRPMSLSLRDEEQIAAVSAYVASLPRVPVETTLEGGDATRGKTLYAPCAACHGPDAAGIQQLNGSPLRASSDWYLQRQIRNFRSGIRGTNPKDTSGALMRPMSMTLPDEQAILDVIAYITTLGGSGSH
jgi:cytochrome c oxidase subunit 2